MRAVQSGFGLVVILFGALLLLATSGLVSMTPIDVGGSALILSGLLFWIPGIALRQRFPWLTALFIPGSLAFATGAILMYTGRTGMQDWWYLWTVELIALGFAFLAMYYLGPRMRLLQFVGTIVGGIGVVALALFLTLFITDPAARAIGPIVLIVLGVLLALGALVPRP